MEFRPCIDIHNGKVKQIVGGSLCDEQGSAVENFVAEADAAYFAKLYQEYGIKGGHVILLNAPDSACYADTKKQALEALKAYPGGLQIGGGITAQNAEEYIKAGASHVIVTSYVFRDGKINYDNLSKLEKAVGAEHIVLDLSCRKKGDDYIIVTDRWQKETQEKVTLSLLNELSRSCDEFLIHAVDVEGKANGIEKQLAALLGEFEKCPITYAGGVHNFEDLKALKELGKNRIHVTIGSALDLFGGNMAFTEVLSYVNGTGNRER